MPSAPKKPTPRTLTPENPVVSYPTPNTADLMVVQDVDTRTPGYVALSYGDLHPDQISFPGLKLVYQTPLDQEQNFMWVRRIYATDRSNQDTYNYAIKYAGSDPNFPTYIRTYTFPRAGYVALGRGSVDPLFPTAPNGNPIVLNTEEVTRYKDESDAEDKTLDSQYIKVTRVYITLPGPTIYGGQVDARYGIPVPVEKQTVPAGVGPSVVQAEDGSIRSSDIDPVDTLQSTRLTSILPQLPEPQVWYGTRQVTGLPPVLVSAEIVGTEQLAFVPHFEECPDGPHKARYTRTFSFGPPSEEPVLSHLLSPQTFNAVIEYSSTRVSYSDSEGSGTNSSTSQGTSSSTQSSTSSSTSTGTSSATQSGTSYSTSQGTSSSTQSGTSYSTSQGTSSSTQSGTSTSSQTASGTNSGTSNSSSTGSSSGSSSSQTTSSGTNSGTSNSSSSGTSSGTDSRAASSSSTQSIASAENAPVIAGSTTKNTVSSGSSSESSSHNGTNSSTGNSTTSGTSSGTSSSSGTNSGTSISSSSSSTSGTSNSSSNSSGSNSSTSQGTNFSTQSGTNTSTTSGTSNSTSSGTSTSSSQGTSSSTSSGNNTSTSSGTNSSTSQGSSTYSSTSFTRSTSKSLLSIQLPKCLRSFLLVQSPGGNVSVSIPATSPSTLPYGSWYEVGRSADYWKYGIWVTEQIEVLLRKE